MNDYQAPTLEIVFFTPEEGIMRSGKTPETPIIHTNTSDPVSPFSP